MHVERVQPSRDFLLDTMAKRSCLLALALLGAALADDLAVDRSGAAETYDGIGGLSGGGARAAFGRPCKGPRSPQPPMHTPALGKKSGKATLPSAFILILG